MTDSLLLLFEVSGQLSTVLMSDRCSRPPSGEFVGEFKGAAVKRSTAKVATQVFLVAFRG